MSDNRAAFVKMNGIGNKIIVADMRGRSDTITAAAAVRLAGRDAIPFDQIMEVRDPQGKDRDFDIRIPKYLGITVKPNVTIDASFIAKESK